MLRTGMVFQLQFLLINDDAKPTADGQREAQNATISGAFVPSSHWQLFRLGLISGCIIFSLNHAQHASVVAQELMLISERIFSLLSLNINETERDRMCTAN
jgi:hypothetical protein